MECTLNIWSLFLTKCKWYKTISRDTIKNHFRGIIYYIFISYSKTHFICEHHSRYESLFPCNILSRNEKIFGCNLDVVLVFFYKILHITHMMHRHEQRKIIFPNSTLFWSLSIPIWVVIDAFWYFFTWGGIYLVNKKISLTSGLATLNL